MNNIYRISWNFWSTETDGRGDAEGGKGKAHAVGENEKEALEKFKRTCIYEAIEDKIILINGLYKGTLDIDKEIKIRQISERRSIPELIPGDNELFKIIAKPILKGKTATLELRVEEK